MQKRIRNFSIIAHIDHGKSTLADRLLVHTGAVQSREVQEQMLDSMDLERERGITIKAQAVRLKYHALDGNDYILQLIDTPGHVDFTYEVSRSLAACEGALLIVDASQGVEAQTIANAFLAKKSGLVFVPVINKIDLPNADIEKVQLQIEEILKLDGLNAVLASAKKGIGTEDVLEAIVHRIPPPKGDPKKPLKALVFDSWFDSYQGVVALIRVMDGEVRLGTQIMFMSHKHSYEVNGLGVFTPKKVAVDVLSAGEVGFLTASIKKVGEVKVGDTITEMDRPTQKPLSGYRDVKPMVFCGLYAVQSEDYQSLREALDKLKLNDSSFTFEPESSLALGFGFRCGFLGLLHMEIVRERLEREYKLNLISTAPTVIYRVIDTKGKVLSIDNPAKLPAPQFIQEIEEPFLLVTLLRPDQYLGNILQLCEERRGIQREIKYLDPQQVMVTYELPFNEVLLDFYDRLKSISKGYASLDYEFLSYRKASLVKVDILLNGENVDALSFVCHKDKSYHRARQLAEKMKEMIPRQLFEVAIQAAVGSKIIARETVKALRKNVTAKCYGGDITRKRKLWEKQKEGKKRMKQVGRVEVPQEAFLALLKVDQ